MSDFIKHSANTLQTKFVNIGKLTNFEQCLVLSAILLSQKLGLANNTTICGNNILNFLNVKLLEKFPNEVTKIEKIINQFAIIKNNLNLNTTNITIGQTPINYFFNFVQNLVSSSQQDLQFSSKFLEQFIKYSKDSNSLGIVLTPTHITNLVCDLLNVKESDSIFEPCCGSGNFLNSCVQKIQNVSIYGIELRDDLFTIVATNAMLLNFDLSCIDCEDFLKTDCEILTNKNFNIGFINPPFSQSSNTDTKHLTEIKFIEHFLNSMSVGGKCAAIIPQSTMVGKTLDDKKIKAQILKNHTLEGVITLRKETFYGVGTNTCIAIFTAKIPHDFEKNSKFINFENDGYHSQKNIGLIPTDFVEIERKKLLNCWHFDNNFGSKFSIFTKIENDDEWLHSFYYFNDEIPNDSDFEKTVDDYLVFEFNMIIQNREYLFKNGE